MTKERMIFFFAIINYVVELYREDEMEHLEIHREKTQGNEHKVQDGKLQIFSQLSNTLKSFPERLQNLHPWSYSKLNWTWPWAIRSSKICFQQEAGSDDFQRSLPI